MAVATYTSNMNTLTDAAFRVWGKELSDTMQALGLVKTTDTGQVNWATVLRPAANTAGGYEIYRFSDALQATAPVFIRISYGIGPNTNMPMCWVSVGTGTTGGGTLNGFTTPVAQAFHGRTSMTPPQNTLYPTKVCVLPGYLMVCFKLNTAPTSPICWGFFMVSRTCDPATGANTGDGVSLYHYYGDTNTALGFVARHLNLSTGRLIPAATWNENHHAVPFGITNSLVDGEAQLFRHVGVYPQAFYNNYICTYLKTEIAEMTEFSAKLVGDTARNYLALGANGDYTGSQRSSNHCNAVMFE